MATVEDLCKDLASGDQVKNFRAWDSLLEMATDSGAPGRGREKAQLAKSLTAWLVPEEMLKPKKVEINPKTERPNPVPFPIKSSPETETLDAARSQAFQILSIVAGKKQVKALQAALDDLPSRESARYCLDRMTCREAADALAEAVGKEFGTEFRVGVINSLAHKSGAKVVAALKTCTQDPELEVRLAAAEALANQPDAAHDEVIVAMIDVRDKSASNKRASARLTRARIRLAEKLATAGKAAAAKSIYESVSKANVDPAQQQAAKDALTRLG